MDLNPSTPARLYTMTNDVYAKSTVSQVADVLIFLQDANQWTRGGNVQTLNADSVAVITPNAYETLTGQAGGRLEGLLLHVSPFSDYTWYRITSSSVGRDLLLGNTIKHYELALTRSKKIAGVVAE